MPLTGTAATGQQHRQQRHAGALKDSLRVGASKELQNVERLLWDHLGRPCRLTLSCTALPDGPCTAAARSEDDTAAAAVCQLSFSYRR